MEKKQEISQEKTVAPQRRIVEKAPQKRDAFPWSVGAGGLGLLGIVVIVGVFLIVRWISTPAPSATPQPAFPPIPVIITTQPAPTREIPSATNTIEFIPTDNYSTSTRPADGMIMVLVPSGEFSMGSNDGDPDEQPVHIVTLDSFWIDQTEVTNAMYAMCVDAGNCNLPRTFDSINRSGYYGLSQYYDYPVINISWYDANDYCTWAGGRLPAEAEWEKAARGTDGRTYPWGEGIDSNRANYGSNFDDTVEVGSYPAGASPYGALDMAGNVMEWVADLYSSDYYASSPSNNPTGPVTGNDRVVRGGSWGSNSSDIRSANRKYFTPEVLKNFYGGGFRCVVPFQ